MGTNFFSCHSQNGKIVQNLLQQIHDDTDLYTDIENQLKYEETNLSDLLQKNSSKYQSLSTNIHFIILILGVFAVWGLDFFLLGGVEEYLCSLRDLPKSTEILAKILIPGFFILIEMLIAVHIHLTSEIRKKKCKREPFLFWFWISLGVIFPLSIAVLTAVLELLELTEQKALGDSSVAFPSYLVIGLIILFLACHFCMIFSGKFILEAKTYFVFIVRRKAFRKKIQNISTRIRQLRSTIRFSVVQYITQFNQNSQRYTLNTGAGPFSKNCINVVNSIFGYELMLLPNTNKVNENKSPHYFINIPVLFFFSDKYQNVWRKE